MPLRQPAREESWPMGRGPHGCQDGGVLMAEAAFWWGNSNSSSGQVTNTCGIAGSWRFGTTRKRGQ